MGKLATLFFSAVLGGAMAAENPQIEIANKQIHAKLYLPDAQNGFYKPARFDWSGVIFSLEFQGHNFYGPWFTKGDPTIRDFAYKDSDIVVGPASAMMGPVEEFQKPLGDDTAKAGGTFVKVGVVVLRQPDDTAYNFGKLFELVDSGKWSVRSGSDFVSFTQTLSDAESGYGYVYTKTLRLTADKSQVTIEHSLRNTGKQPIATNVYDHNFLVFDKMGPGPDYTITVPFHIKPTRAPNADFAEIHGAQAVFKKAVENQDRAAFGLHGYGPEAKDYDFRIEHRKAGVEMRITGDRPLSNASLWSIRSVLAVEPFIDVAADPGTEYVEVQL